MVFRKSVCLIYIFLIINSFVFTQSQSDVAGIDTEVSDPEAELFLETTDDRAPEVEPFGVWNTIKVFVVLIVFILIAAGIVIFFKRLQNPTQYTYSESIKVVSRKTISHTNNLYLVKVARGYLLMSQSGQSIVLVKEFNEKEDIDAIELSLSIEESQDKNLSSSQSFYQKLQKKLSFLNTGVVHTTIYDEQSKSHATHDLLATLRKRNTPHE